LAEITTTTITDLHGLQIRDLVHMVVGTEEDMAAVAEHILEVEVVAEPRTLQQVMEAQGEEVKSGYVF